MTIPNLLQDQFKDVNDSDLKAMDGQISELGAELQSLTQSCRQLDAGKHSCSMELVFSAQNTVVMHFTEKGESFATRAEGAEQFTHDGGNGGRDKKAES